MANLLTKISVQDFEGPGEEKISEYRKINADFYIHTSHHSTAWQPGTKADKHAPFTPKACRLHSHTEERKKDRTLDTAESSFEMSTSRLETVRALHEEIDLQQERAVEELLEELKLVKQRVARDNTVASRVEQIIDSQKRVLDIYEDEDGSREAELNEMKGDKAFGLFYDRMTEIKRYHRLHSSDGLSGLAHYNEASDVRCKYSELVLFPACVLVFVSCVCGVSLWGPGCMFYRLAVFVLIMRGRRGLVYRAQLCVSSWEDMGTQPKGAAVVLVMVGS